ncbi:MAG: MFS transporter [Armatimonadetes bacterium]|nr:MFS transporter [Armatimonadota bacterium]
MSDKNIRAAAVIEKYTGKSEKTSEGTLSVADVRHNMIFIVMLDAIFTMGVSDLQIVTGPVWKYLGASNTLIGLVGSLAASGLIGVFLSPFISVRYTYKKWYLFVSHLPYIGAWGVLGLVMVLAPRLGLSDEWLLVFTIVMLSANHLFGGFVGLPHQEYIVACIPMSHRGRYTGYSYSIGSALSIITAMVGGIILLHVSRPAAFGYLFLMTWFFCQGGYILALFGRERPTPVRNAPKPWSKRMLRAAWNDRRFLRLIVLSGVFLGLYWPAFFIYLPQYGLRDLHMIDATSAIMGSILLVARIGVSSPVGHLTDRLSPKRVLTAWPLVAALGLVCAVVLRSQWGVYIATALGAVVTVGIAAALNPMIFGLPAPENRSGHYTLQLLLTYVANAVGPFVIGVLCDLIGYKYTFSVLAAVSFALFPLTIYLLADLSDDPQDYS